MSKVACAECGRCVDDETIHDDHWADCPRRLTGDLHACSCDRPVCPDCCTTCTEGVA